MPCHPSLRIIDYLEIAQVFHWASRDHYVSFFTGYVKRHKRTETLLPRLVQRNKLRVAKFGKKNVYSVPRKARKMIDFDDPLIEHGVACTEGLVRFYRADMNCTLISEKFFSRFEVEGLPRVGDSLSQWKTSIIRILNRQQLQPRRGNEKQDHKI